MDQAETMIRAMKVNGMMKTKKIKCNDCSTTSSTVSILVGDNTRIEKLVANVPFEVAMFCTFCDSSNLKDVKE